MNQLRVLSLGWGVQSWTLAAMAALGDIPKIDVAVHSDTTHEASGTYAHAKKWTPWLEARGIPVVTVKADNPDVIRQEHGNSVIIPAFTVSATGKRGQVRRQCTNRWKIQPIRRYMRTLLPPNPKPGSVDLVLGISWDEALRMRTSDIKYAVNSFPLVDQRIKRSDCITYLQNNGLDVPPKSACVFCPYHSRDGWRELKRQGGSDWNRAVAVDSNIRNKQAKKGAGWALFIHPFREPLEKAIQIPEDVGAKQLMLGDGDPTCDSGFCFM